MPRKKRVSRAIERLRECFAKRGITVGVGALVVVITANAFRAEPVGLAATIATAAALAGTAIATTTTAYHRHDHTAKTVIAVTLTTAVGTESTKRAKLNPANASPNAPAKASAAAKQVKQLTREFDDAINRLTALQDDNERLNRNATELLKLRVEVGMLRQTNQGLQTALAKATPQPSSKRQLVKENLLKML